MTEDSIDERVSKIKEEMEEFFRKEFTPIIENAFNPESITHYKLDEEPPCPEITEMIGELSSMIQTHISSLAALGVSPKQMLSYIFLGQSQFAAMKALFEMGVAIGGLKQKTIGSDKEQIK